MMRIAFSLMVLAALAALMGVGVPAGNESTSTSVSTAQAASSPVSPVPPGSAPVADGVKNKKEVKENDNGNAESLVHLPGQQLLLLIALCGFFGGAVDGLRTQKSYKARLGALSLECGSFGDGLVGTTAAIAIFAFAENVFGGEGITSPMKLAMFVKVVAWCVLSGYVGARLLDTLSSKLLIQAAMEAASAEAKKAVSKDEQAQQTVREAEHLVAQHNTRIASLVASKALRAGVTDVEAENLLKDAQRKYDQVLESDPANTAAQIGLANVHGYRGDYLHLIKDEKGRTTSYKEAIKLLDALINRDPKVAKAYYNRACCKALLGDDRDDAARDLNTAIQLDKSFEEYAKGDNDLKSLRGRKDLKFLPKALAAT